MAEGVEADTAIASGAMACDARISACGQYRWWLRRSWNPQRPGLLFIGLNPSRAGAERDDPTLRRLLGFTRRWGHGSLTVVNLFARIAARPAALRRCDDPIGAANDGWIRRALLETASEAAAGPDGPVIWLGWGNGGCWRGRQSEVVDRILSRGGGGRLRCLGFTARGQPRHPLYARSDAPLVPFVLARSEPSAAS